MDLTLAVAALAAAIALRPWRLLDASGPPWAWVAAWSVLPLLWGSQATEHTLAAPAMSGAAALVLLCGWPLAVPALAAVAAATVLGGDLDWAAGLHRYVWLGVVPATLALAAGTATRRWLPRHPCAYILGRGYGGTFVVSTLAATAAGWAGAHGAVAPLDAWLARLLLAGAEAGLTGTVAACCVAGRPEWLATYADRIYLPAPPR